MHGTVTSPDGTQYRADMDCGDEALNAYFESMKGKILYKTAFATQGEMQKTIEPFLKEGKDVLVLTLSSALSGTYQSCMLASKGLMEMYPERKIICVDTLRYSSAISFLLVKAAEKKKEGATIEETADYLNEIKHRVHQAGPLDDLFFCVKTGRISNFKAFFGTLVGVHCLGEFNKGGMTEVIGKAKGKAAAINAAIEYIKKTIENPEEQIVFVGHSNRTEHAERLAQRIRDEIKPKEVIVNSIGLSCGASIGPGLCAAYYMGAPVSENLETEKKLMEESIQNLKK